MAQSNAELNEQIVRRIVRGFAANDVRPLTEALGDDVVWISHSSPPYFRFGGECHGRIRVMEALAKIYADFSFVKYDCDVLTASGNEVFALNDVALHHKPSDRTISFRLAFRMTFAGGKLTRYEGFFDTASVLQQVGLLAGPEA